MEVPLVRDAIHSLGTEPTTSGADLPVAKANVSLWTPRLTPRIVLAMDRLPVMALRFVGEFTTRAA